MEGFKTIENKPREAKEQLLGKSKIEKGLREFRIYRVAPADKLLKLSDRTHGTYSDNNVLGRLLRRSLFFTTQKNMALEFRTSNRSEVLIFEKRGSDFLNDLNKLNEQNVKLVLFSHEDVGTFQRIISGEIKSEQQIVNFINNHTFQPNKVSLRMLRRAAEIIVLLPEGLDYLPLSERGLRREKIEDLEEKYKRRGDWARIISPGGFHRAVVKHQRRPDRHLRQLKKLKNAKQKEKDNLVASHPLLNDETETKIRILRDEIEELNFQISERLAEKKL